MSAKHAPGPWEVVERVAPYEAKDGLNDYPFVSITIPDSLNHDGLHHRAVEVRGDNCEANARLIAAAPDLLVSAKAAALMISELARTRNLPIAPYSDLGRLLAAIARAEARPNG